MKHLPDDCRAIIQAMQRVSKMADHEVPLVGFHYETGLSPGDFDSALTRLIQLRQIDKFVLYGQVRIRIAPSD